MILTFKVRHGRDFSTELQKARQIADFALETRTLSSARVRQFGLKSAISNQILREYSRNRKLKGVGNVNLIVPGQSIRKEGDELKIACLKLSLPITFRKDFTKVNQIELDKEYAFISVTVPDTTVKQVSSYIGVDRNTTGHIAVVSVPQTGKVYKLGKKAQHIHRKYREMRRDFQRKGKYGLVKKVKHRESNIVKDLNHKVSKKIVEIAEQTNSGIKLEQLNGIRNNRKHSRGFNYSLHSWSFYQLQIFIEYKARMLGIPIVYVEPRNTSKECSRCGSIGTRTEKKFVCQSCGYVEHADANAGFNIALRQGIVQSVADRDAMEGSTDTPKEVTLGTTETLEPHKL